jgi:hypothetical protein
MSQKARPDSTVATGGWTVTGAPTRHEAVDEVTPDDVTTTVNCANTNTGTLELGLSNVVDPGVNFGHVIRWRTGDASGFSYPSYAIALYQGSTLIKQGPQQNAVEADWTTYEILLSEAEAAAITDYTDLRVRIAPPGSQEHSGKVTWVELQVPLGSSPGFPEVIGEIASFETGAVTLHDVAVPLGDPGDLLLMLYGSDEVSGTITWPSGFVQVAVAPASPPELRAAWKEASGGEGSSLVVQTTNVEESAHLVWRVKGPGPWTAPEGGGAGASGSSMDPPLLDPVAWDVENTLWLAAALWVSGTEVLTGYPASYVNGLVFQDPGAIPTFAIARRELAAGSENPGAFVKSGTGGYAALTLAIRPRLLVAGRRGFNMPVKGRRGRGAFSAF